MKAKKPLLILAALPLLVLCFANAAAADPPKSPARFFALYPVVPVDSPARSEEGFEYEIPFSGRKIAKGAYSQKAILTLEHLEKVDTEWREVAIRPVLVLRFRLNDSGVRQLQHYLRQSAPTEVVAIIDGHAYSTIPVDFVRDMSKERVLSLVLPSPEASTASHFVELLAEKLQSAIARRSSK